MVGISTEPEKVTALVQMIPLIYGKPCVNFASYDGTVNVSRRIYGLKIDWSSIGKSVFYEIHGKNDWVDPPRKRPDSLTDGLAIGSDCLEVGPMWWFDTYFRWWLVFDPALVARSMAGDHSWTAEFLQLLARPTAVSQRQAQISAQAQAKSDTTPDAGSKARPGSRSKRQK